MIAIDGYVVTDEFFGEPQIDVDEERDAPLHHRYVHGGFAGTDTRFSFYFPMHGWQGRMLNPLQGGFGGTEHHFGSPAGEVMGGVAMCARLGGYMVESNQGHQGDRVDPKAGDDKSIHSWRASAEVARFSKFVAAQLYGERTEVVVRLRRQWRWSAIAAVPRVGTRRVGRRDAVHGERRPAGPAVRDDVQRPTPARRPDRRRRRRDLTGRLR